MIRSALVPAVVVPGGAEHYASLDAAGQVVGTWCRDGFPRGALVEFRAVFSASCTRCQRAASVRG